MQKNRDSEFIVLTTVTNAGDLAMIKSLLDNADIPYFVTNENFSTLFGGANGLTKMEVMVEKDKLEEAKEILQAFLR